MIELKKKDLRGYSLRKIIDAGARGRAVDGLERELSQECERHSSEKAGGVTVPWQVFAPGLTGSTRDLAAGTFNQGGAFIGTDILEPVDILRNRTVCFRLGAKFLTGLNGHTAFPRKTGTVTAQALPEAQTLTKSTPNVDQILLSPHRIGAWCDYSRQLVLQGSTDVENWLRDDLLQTLAVKWDYLMLQGAGANSEPTGILNTAGIASVLFGGAATWASVISFETDLAQQNADVTNGSFGFVTTPAVRAKWKNIAKIGSTFPIFLWDLTNQPAGSPDGLVNGYRATVTNQILNNQVCFGNFAELIFALWGAGPDILVNPYSRDTDASIRVTVNTFIDVAVRHAASFAWSADAGNQ